MKKTKQNKACVDSLHSEYRTVHCPKKALHLELERERERENEEQLEVWRVSSEDLWKNLLPKKKQ